MFHVKHYTPIAIFVSPGTIYEQSIPLFHVEHFENRIISLFHVKHFDIIIVYRVSRETLWFIKIFYCYQYTF